MFYTITALSYNKDIVTKLEFNDTMLEILIVFGIWILIPFSCIFIFYTNSFLTKQRKKEIGLYNILGMGKKHIMCMLLFENIYTIIISISAGLLLGIIFGKILFLLLLRIIGFVNQKAQFPISMSAIDLTILVFISIFLATLLSNLWQIYVSNPIHLLQSGNMGEKEPKAKWIISIIGVLSLGFAYYIAPSNATELQYAFLPTLCTVVLLILGTYALFIGVSITLLKFLKQRKRFYYKTSHFTIISGMLYRMKHNAVGLANICLLSTLSLCYQLPYLYTLELMTMSPLHFHIRILSIPRGMPKPRIKIYK